ncbi:glycine C-acetyltransferase [Candidatus Woesebacteria bacterium RIFOXYC1_FULL_31_51]|uniref:8-amino-7-oxononanoate synthetase n=1 Tax=Candidatus Woesebacteria bacterium GW2011_GWC2_31_9 TaxID=1618586 RepID=A0A0F9YJJ7_9BACT|nr:MAG: 8-amino-7-oxononanoate synthase, glycine C-acetyltransferase [Candidatus Woesebacteria bacterium GW2011_GWF1_31_35]KKP23165.1 MAG: 8-amino-7-oxononanoate synthetase [Candidatus Woesebacteria bacterium GW2011_GWC1_30_29]KKP26853.1 MAG: 8-amino-7-oxononanoate synthetase [Candidatus Woesebacteria bacterium GW2011_GWD1_31_12]KKP27427.1 MAG: 8-amino-7-oxononanoate synthetase [Candidatus Woesebacteria bacterium GW2011_GWB1_31_29]KKP31689.1 MAG: 8-amino-7-oxononanoate synthetase [Candidatus Wo
MWLTEELNNLKKSGLYNNILTIESPIGGEIIIEGRKLLNFCSNNYLGLANNPRLKKAAIAAINKFGVGPAAVRTIAGTTTLHKKLEKDLAKFKKCEAVLTFQSGFMANLATIPALVGEGDLIFSDELNHASIIDGCRISKATVIRFKHADTVDLESLLKKASKKVKKLVITDGVFSMDGDIAPLDKIYKVTSKYGALLMVDDAHGEGVLGRNGRGIVDHFNLHGKVDIEVGTMSKALGVVGGLVAGKGEIIEWLTQRARPFLFSSAMTIPDVGACIEAVKILGSSGVLVKKLWSNADYLSKGLSRFGFDTGKSQTPIIPLMLGEVTLAKEFSNLLFENGVFAKAIGYPTVPEGKARIRIMNTAVHTKKDLDKALLVFEKVGKTLKVI